MKYCPKCNSEYDDNVNFCKHDGSPLEAQTHKKAQEKKCPSCGKLYPEEGVFCMICGLRLQSNVLNNDTESNFERGKRKYKNSTDELVEVLITGDAKNLFEVGKHYYYGIGGTVKNLSNAYYLIQKAANQGNIDAKKFLVSNFKH